MTDPALQIPQLNKALEFAHYLAGGAERLIEAMNTRDAIWARIDDGQESEQDLDAALERAQEKLGEYTRYLRNDIYEFRKRAGRISPAAAPAVAISAPAPDPAPAPQHSKSGGLTEVPDYVPPDQRGTGLTTYWLWYGQECVSTVRLPPGTGAVDVRNEAVKDAVIFCDRARGESPIERETKIRHSIVRVYDDRPVQERMRRELPFERRALFPNEMAFFELVFRSREDASVSAVHVRDLSVGLQDVALAEGLDVTFTPCEGPQRQMRVQGEDRAALGRIEHAAKEYLAERGAELVSEFGVGYVRVEVNDVETEVERPRG